MKLLLALALATLPCLAAGREVRFPDRGLALEKLEADLRAKGFRVAYTQCSGGTCAMTLEPGEAKDPLPVIDAATELRPKPQAAEKERTEEIARLAPLVKKLKDGTITNPERDELLSALIARVFGL